MNIVQILGHLGADAEIRYTTNGQKVTTLRVATNNRRGDTEETIWWRVTVWGDRFDKMVPYLKKGSSVIVVGELKKPEIWTGQDGQPRLTLELTAEFIRFSPFGRGTSSQQPEQAEFVGGVSAPSAGAFEGQGEGAEFMPPAFEEAASTAIEDDIPF